MWRLMNYYPLQDGDPDAGGGGDPPADPPADPPPEGDPPADATIALDVLPEDLRNRPAAEVKFLLEHMVNTLGSQNTEVADLKTQVATLTGRVDATPPAEPDPDDDKTLEELMLEDSGKAIDRYLTEKGYVGAVGDLSSQVGSAVFSMVAGKVEGFSEYEEDVKDLLLKGKLPFSEFNIMGAYKMVLGEKALEDQARAARSDTTVPPSTTPVPDPETAPAVLSVLEQEVAAAHGMTDEQWVASREMHLDEEIKLPT